LNFNAEFQADFLWKEKKYEGAANLSWFVGFFAPPGQSASPLLHRRD
jgi:hypothetical protein